MAITLASSLPVAAFSKVASAVSCADRSRSSSSAVHPVMGPEASAPYSTDQIECSAVVAKESEQDEENRGPDVELVPFIGNGHADSHSHEKTASDFKSCGGGSPRENCHSEMGIGTTSGRYSSKSGVGRLWRRFMKLFPGPVTRSIHELCCGTKLCILLPLVPITLVLDQFNVGHGYIFLLSLLGIAPLAERLGFVTEQLSAFTGPTIGGLLNATFGNATEMIISILALRQSMIRVVQLSLLGSILSNVLLVLGCAFLFGGLANKQKDQTFNKAAALVSSGLLLMAVMGLLFPAVLHATHTEIHDGKSELSLSRFSSCVMLVAYGSYLYFQLKSHRQLYDCEDEDEESEEGVPEEETLGLRGWIVWLGILTILISLLSDTLVDTIHGASEMWNVPVAFISVVILPIVGNAAEHASSIMFAVKDKLDISLGVAIGSSTQISMFVIPFCVVVGWIIGVDMDLDFQLFETATLFSTVLVVAAVLQEGTANYFKGLMLVFCYLIVSASYWVHVDNNSAEDTKGRG
ncbi:unnamed protein product [Calypogeia fissa]